MMHMLDYLTVYFESLEILLHHVAIWENSKLFVRRCTMKKIFWNFANFGRKYPRTSSFWYLLRKQVHHFLQELFFKTDLMILNQILCIFYSVLTNKFTLDKLLTLTIIFWQLSTFLHSFRLLQVNGTLSLQIVSKLPTEFRKSHTDNYLQNIDSSSLKQHKHYKESK